MMNKTIAYLLMAMFVFSIPASIVYAEDDDNDDLEDEVSDAEDDASTDAVSNEKPKLRDFKIANSERIESLSEEQQAIFEKLSRAEQKEILKSANINRDIGKYQLRKIEKALLFKKRVIAKEQMQRAIEEYKEAKEKYKEEAKAYKENKKEFDENKKKLKECEDDEDDNDVEDDEDSTTEECKDLEAQVLEDAKEFLTDGVNMLIDHLKQIKEKVTSSETMEADRVSEITTSIDSKISELESTLADIEAAQTKEELKEISKKVHRTWADFKHKERLYVARLIHAKVWGILERSKHLEQKLENILTKMEEKGIDVSDIDEEIGQFSEKINEAKTKYEEGKKILDAAYAAKDTTTDKKAIVTQVKEAEVILKEAKEALKEANSILSKIIKKIRSKGGEINNTTTEEEYKVVETSTETAVTNEGG